MIFKSPFFPERAFFVHLSGGGANKIIEVVMNKYRFDTIAVTGGFTSDMETGATNVPIHMSNAYQFKSAENAAGLFNLTEGGYIYTRLHNPTTSVLEERIAMLENGVAAVATASGHFAELMVFASLCRSGDEIVASSRLYGGTINMMATSLKRFGITVHFADQRRPETWEALINSRTKALYMETLANPDSSIPDFEAFAKIASKHNIPLIVDNTMATPYLFRPADFGANIVVHSTTKYLCGNASAMGGVAVDIGNFDWKKGNFPELTAPDSSYHGMVFDDAFGKAALAVYMRTKVMRDFGGCPSPFNSFLTLQGIQTLHLRMPRHVQNAEALAKFLETDSHVDAVSYPGLKSHRDHHLAQKYMPKGAGGLLSFEVKGGYDNAKKIIENIKLCVHATNVGDARTVFTHPASTTHRQASEEQLKNAGISPAMIRVSLGIEDIDDIIEDLKQAMTTI